MSKPSVHDLSFSINSTRSDINYNERRLLIRPLMEGQLHRPFGLVDNGYWQDSGKPHNDGNETKLNLGAKKE